MDRKEYIETRNIYIKWAMNASNALQKIILLVSTGWFVYTKSIIWNVEWCSHMFLIISWWLFALSLISSILAFYWSWESHEIQLEIYDKDYNKEKDNDYMIKKNRLQKINNRIEIMESVWVFTIILWIIFLFTSFLV